MTSRIKPLSTVMEIVCKYKTVILTNVLVSFFHIALVLTRLTILCPSVHGGWGNWTQWSDCSTTCGNGTQIRTRRCDNPAPMYNGSDCIGESREEKGCFLRHCPGKEDFDHSGEIFDCLYAWMQ